jgi:hypothetical protein
MLAAVMLAIKTAPTPSSIPSATPKRMLEKSTSLRSVSDPLKNEEPVAQPRTSAIPAISLTLPDENESKIDPSAEEQFNNVQSPHNSEASVESAPETEGTTSPPAVSARSLRRTSSDLRPKDKEDEEKKQNLFTSLDDGHLVQPQRKLSSASRMTMSGIGIL